MPGGTTPPVVAVPPQQDDANVVYLGDERGERPDGTVPPNPRATDYEGVEPIPAESRPEPAGPQPIPIRPLGAEPAAPSLAEVEQLRQRNAELEAALPAFGSHGPLPQPHELVPPPRVDDNPFGDFFGDGASAWLEEDPEDAVEITQPRVVGTMLAAGAVTMLLAAWAIWGVAMYRGAGGAEAGGFVLLAMLLWIWYLSMPREQQHAFMLRRHQGMQSLVDRRVTPIRERTEGQLAMRSEKGRYRAMRDERTRRVNALGESAYRAFRHGTLPAELQAGAQRVLAMERQMLSQDQRIHQMVEERQGGGHAGTDPASDVPEGGHAER